MATFLDIIIASIIGGVLLLGIINANNVVAENSYIINGDVLVQQMLISTVQIVEGEFRNMGVGVNEDSASVIFARDTAITFLSDIDRDGTPDRIEYWSGKVSELAHTQNERDRFLHRRVNGGTRQSIGIVTGFKLRYYSQGQLDTLTPPVAANDLAMIKIVEITLEVQNSYALYRDPRDVRPGEQSALFSSSYWRQTRLASQNFKR
ncbi:MAG: hypothetical protein QME58_11280 [Bacteroidota bacterium]|nr:hypothetical protein [Bacteroidota bacterium]